MDTTQIAWHPAFIEAIQLELEDYSDVLEFFPEYQLTSEPLRIDCVVIKKPKNVVIKKNIAAIFREVYIPHQNRHSVRHRLCMSSALSCASRPF